MEKKVKVFNDIYLDQDTDPKLNQGSDYILNTILTSDGRYKVCANIKGNELVTDQILLNSQFWNPDHTPIKIVGSCRDDARNRIVYFITNNIPSQGEYYSGIMYLDITNGENKFILLGYYLGLTYTSAVNARIIGDLLYWTDGDNPKKINYIKAYNYQQNISTDYKYQTVDANVIDAYKKPPSVPIIAGASTSIYATKVISNKVYQFAYRYTYGDNEKSVLSPFSNIVFSDIQQFPDGSGTLYSSAWGIQLNFKIFENISGAYNDVNFVELFVRNSDLDNWYLYDKIESPKMSTFVLTYFSSGSYNQGSGINVTNVRGTVTQSVYNKLTIGQYISRNLTSYHIVEKYTSGSNYIIGLDTTISGTGWSYTFTVLDDFVYIFKDDKIKQAVDQNDLARPFDYIPKKANNQELIEKDKLIYADITEGFNQVKINVETSIVTNTYSAYGAQFTVGHYEPLTTTGKAYFRIRWEAYSYPVYYSIVANYKTQSGTTGVISAGYTSVSTDNETKILNVFLNILKSYGFTDVSILTNTSPSYKYIRVPHNGGLSGDWGTSSESIYSFVLSPTFKSLKNNDSYLGGIVYYDKNLRFSSVQKFEKEIITPKNNVFSFKEYTSLECKIKNKPPLEAYYYSLCFTKRCKQSNIIRIVVPPTYSYVDPKDNLLKLQLNRLINDSTDRDKNLKLKTYVFTPGDRISILGSYHIANPISFSFDTPFLLDFIYDFEIKGEEWPTTDARYQKDYATTAAYIVDSNGNKIYNPASQVLVIPNPSLGTLTGAMDNMVIEIYTPKKEASNPYYFPNYFGIIGNPGTANNYHIGTSQNQNPSNPALTPAIINCNPGDVYLKFRYAIEYYPSIDENYSDYYDSNSYGYGMPNIFDPDAKEERLIAGMRYSGSLLHDTKINRLNRFDSADRVILKSKFGNIHSIKEVGDVLKVLQDKKETSIYIGKEEITNSDGSTILRTTTNVLGNQNAYDELRGTIYPKSVVVHNRNMYYWDSIRKEVIRSSPNGQFPISAYGMNTYFKSKTGYTDVVASFDEENSLYILTFIGNISQTIGFYDPDNEAEKPKWLSFYSFIPELYENIGKYFVSFKDGNGYKHNSNLVNRCTFYGTKFKQQIDWFFNSPIRLLFKSLIIKSNKAWSVPSISIEPDVSNPRGMLSKLNVNHFTAKEGVFFASYLNNMITRTSFPSNLDLINGDRLKGFFIKHSMENNDTSEVWFFETEIYFDPSNRYE